MTTKNIPLIDATHLVAIENALKTMQEPRTPCRVHDTMIKTLPVHWNNFDVAVQNAQTELKQKLPIDTKFAVTTTELQFHYPRSFWIIRMTPISVDASDTEKYIDATKMGLHSHY